MDFRSAVSIIKHFEGFRADAYRDPVGIWTIGYGHTRDVTEGMTITEDEGEALLRDDLRDAADAVDRYLPVTKLTWCQRDALVSFIFNVGAGKFRGSTMRAHLLAGNHELAAREFGRWIFAGGKPLRGLIRRRAAECDLYAREPFPK